MLTNKFTIGIIIIIILLSGVVIYQQGAKPSDSKTDQTLTDNAMKPKRPSGDILCSSLTPHSILGIGSHPDVERNYYTDGHCRTLYAYQDDKVDESSCYGECAERWIPYVKNQSGKENTIPEILNADGTKLVDDLSDQTYTIIRQTGEEQYALDGKPLYYFSGDEIGDISGHGFNNKWSLIFTDREHIHKR